MKFSKINNKEISKKKNDKNINEYLNNDNNINSPKNSVEIYPNNINNYSETKTIYEFFIFSLLKNTNITKEKAISIIFNCDKNNFIKIFYNNKDNKDNNNNKQIKEYNSFLKWIKDIKNNYNIVLNILYNYKDDEEIKNVFYKIISMGLYTNNIEIITITSSIIEFSIKKNIINLDWLVTEGYLIYIKDINIFPLIRISLVKNLMEIFKGNEDIFFKMIKNDLINTNLKEQINIFIENVFKLKDESNYFNSIKIKFFFVLQEIYFDYNLSIKQKDILLILNLITIGWINNLNIFNNEYYDNKNDTKIKNTLLIIFQENTLNNKYGINCVCSINNLFLLLDKFGKVKNEDGPLIYKALVYQFINQFENELKKELFLENFINFFFINLKFPIDLFLSPYLEKINQTQKIELNDFNFISIIISHPRFTCENAFEIISLLLDISFSNKIYTQCIIMIINIIFSLNLLSKNKIIYEKSQEKFILYINKVLNIYKEKKIKNNNNDNKYILDIAYYILVKKFGNVNDSIIENLISDIDEYRKIYHKNSKELLKLLWEYDIHDDILLQMEEKYHKENNNINNKIIMNNKNNIVKDNINNKIIINYKNNIDKDNIKPNNCILFKKVKKLNIQSKDKSDKKINIKTKKSLKEINYEIKLKVEDDLRKINENQKKNILLEKQKKQEEELFKTKELIIKQRLMKIFIKRGLFLGISKNKKQRPYSFDIEKRGGLLLEEGEGDMIYPYENLNYKRKKSSMKLNTLLIHNKYKFIVNFFDEETREIKGIEALNQKYKNQIKFLFNKLVDNYDTISKSSLMKFLREKNISNKDFSLDELSLCVKNTFPENLIYFNENEFKNLLIIISYYIMTKKNNMYTLYESYYNFLKIILKNEKENENWKNNKYSKIKKFLKSKLNINNGNINALLPPGFKVVQKSNSYFFKQFPKQLNKIFNESTIICYSLLDDILLKCLNYKHGIMENYIKIEKKFDIEIDSGNIRPWSQDLMIAYSSLPKTYSSIGIEVANLLEEGLRKISLGKNIEIRKKTINDNSKSKDKNNENNKRKDKIKNYNDKNQKNNEVKNNKDLNIIKDHFEIKEKKQIKEIKIFKKIKEQNEKKEEIEKNKNKENKNMKTLKINNIKYKNFNNISELKLRNDDNNSSNKEKYIIKESKQKERIDRNINNIKIIKEKKLKIKLFLTEQNKKIKEELQQLKIERNKKLKILRKRNLSENLLIPKINSNYFLENKEYIELDKKLISNINKIIENNKKINYYLNKYDEHLKFIFDIYHKIGLNSISSINFNIADSLCYNEYKQFLINFGILNVFISMEQMNFIFKRLSRYNNIYKNDDIINNNERINFQQKSYLTFNDFKLSLLLILILCNMENNNIQIMKSNYEKLNEKLVELLFEYLELVIPFYKNDIEDMINQRRNMNNKDFKDWKKKKKNNLLDIFKNLYLNENDFNIFIKKIKNKSDLLLSFGETNIKKNFSEKKIINKKRKIINKKKIKIKNNLKMKYSKSFEKKRKLGNKIYNKANNKNELKNSKEIKRRGNIENNDDMNSIDFSLTYTISTNRDKEINSIENNINTDTNAINKSEFINALK